MKFEEIKGHANDGLLRAENDIIYVRKFRAGKGEIFRSTKTADLTLARRKRDEMFAELWGDRPKMERRSTVGELWTIWVDGMKNAGKRAATLDSIKASWKHLEPVIGHQFLTDVTADWWITQYVPKKRAETHEKRAFFNDRKWLAMFLKWAEETGKGGHGWKRPKLVNVDAPRDRALVFTDDQIAALMDHADWSLMAKIVMANEHFMRRSEIALLHKSRIDRTQRTINLRAEDTKIKKPRSFPYNDSLEWLFQILDWEDEKAGISSDFVFPSPTDPGKSILKDGFNKAWTTCKKRAGLVGQWKFHWMRHTALTRAFKAKTANPALICWFAGLSLEEAQATYIHFQAEDLRAVLS